MIGLEYGNARVRHRKSQLLDQGDYARLLRASSVGGLIGELASGGYAADVADTPPRPRAEDRYDEVLRRHLVRQVTEVRSFYEGDGRRQIDLYLQRWDLRNLQAILRQAAAPTVPVGLAHLVVPAGTIPEPELAELAAQGSLRAVIDLMVAWRLPTRKVARAVLATWPRYEAGEGAMIIEQALHRAFAEHFAAEIEVVGGEPIAGILSAEIDRTNLLAAIRYRQARLDEGATFLPGELEPLPGGTLAEAVLGGVVDADDIAAIIPLLADRVPASWRPAVASWAEHRDAAAFADDLDRVISGSAMAMFVTGDPLGAAVPLAYLAALESEWRNLRLIGQGLVHGLPVALVERLLVVPW